jgi:single-stranded DNA-binding protein
MSQIKSTFTGSVVAEPRFETTPNGASKMTFPVYVNHARKDKASGEFKRTGDVSKIRVTLWGDKTGLDINQGDLVEISATLVEKRWTNKDGQPGQCLETDWVESVTTKFAATIPALGVPSIGIGVEYPTDSWDVADVPSAEDTPF